MRAWLIAGVALCLSACNRAPELSAAFTLAHGPGPIERIECRQGECSWTQRQSTAVLRQTGDGITLKLVGRSGSSTYPLDGQAPPTWTPGMPVAWRAEASYFFCSLTHPAMLWQSDGEFLLDRLDLHSPPGVQVGSANAYMAACHSFTPGKWDGQTLKGLGYAKAVSAQTRYPTLEAGLAAMSPANPSS